MSKKKNSIILKLFFLIIPALFYCHCSNEPQPQDTYVINQEQLNKIGFINDNKQKHLTVDDIQKLKIINTLNISKQLKEKYELTQIAIKASKINIHKNKSDNNKSYLLYSSGLFDLAIKKEYKIESLLKIHYNISVHGECEFTLVDSADEE